MQYVSFILKLLISFIVMLVLLNSFGYRNLSPTSATDQIYNYVLGGIIGGALFNESITILHVLVIMVSWGLLVKAFDLLKTRNRNFRSLIDGVGLVLYQNSQFVVKNIKTANISLQDLVNKLRSQGIKSIDEVRHLELQKNGQLLIIKKSDIDYGFLIVSNGELNHNELEKSGLSKMEFTDLIRKQGVEDYKSLYYCEYKNETIIIKN